MSLEQILLNSHANATADRKTGEDYRRRFAEHLLLAAQDLYNITLSQREMQRFENSLWATVDLWRETQGLKTTGEFLKLTKRYTEKFFADKGCAGNVLL